MGEKPYPKVTAGGIGGSLTAVILALISAIIIGDYETAVLVFAVSILPVIIQFVVAYMKTDPQLNRALELMNAKQSEDKLKE